MDTTTSSTSDMGFGGLVLYENSVGKGTFTGGEFNSRPYWAMIVSVRPKFHISRKLKMTTQLRLDVTKTVIDNADSLYTQNRETILSDLRWNFVWSKFIDLKKVGLSWSTWGEVFFPTSKFSQLTQKFLGVRLGLKTRYKPLKWLSITHQVYATKNFNKYTNTVLDAANFSIAPLSRIGGAEAVEQGLVATGTGVTEWSVSNVLTLGFTFLKDFSATIQFQVANLFQYQSFPIDEFSSQHAVAGKGRTDFMYGTLEIGYDINKYLSVALGTTVEQFAKTPDNKSFYFPFWDTSNGAANRQSFYFDVVGQF